jgi:ribose 5-phosphate isomerase B
MALAANKIKGAYAAVCHDIYSTQRSVLSNNCNTMCMGALVIGPKTAETLVDIWLGIWEAVHYRDKRSQTTVLNR